MKVPYWFWGYLFTDGGIIMIRKTGIVFLIYTGLYILFLISGSYASDSSNTKGRNPTLSPVGEERNPSAGPEALWRKNPGICIAHEIDAMLMGNISKYAMLLTTSVIPLTSTAGVQALRVEGSKDIATAIARGLVYAMNLDDNQRRLANARINVITGTANWMGFLKDLAQIKGTKLDDLTVQLSVINSTIQDLVGGAESLDTGAGGPGISLYKTLIILGDNLEQDCLFDEAKQMYQRVDESLAKFENVMLKGMLSTYRTYHQIEKGQRVYLDQVENVSYLPPLPEIGNNFPRIKASKEFFIYRNQYRAAGNLRKSNVISQRIDALIPAQAAYIREKQKVEELLALAENKVHRCDLSQTQNILDQVESQYLISKLLPGEPRTAQPNCWGWAVTRWQEITIKLDKRVAEVSPGMDDQKVRRWFQDGMAALKQCDISRALEKLDLIQQLILDYETRGEYDSMCLNLKTAKSKDKNLRYQIEKMIDICQRAHTDPSNIDNQDKPVVSGGAEYPDTGPNLPPTTSQHGVKTDDRGNQGSKRKPGTSHENLETDEKEGAGFELIGQEQEPSDGAEEREEDSESEAGDSDADHGGFVILDNESSEDTNGEVIEKPDSDIDEFAAPGDSSTQKSIQESAAARPAGLRQAAAIRKMMQTQAQKQKEAQAFQQEFLQKNLKIATDIVATNIKRNNQKTQPKAPELPYSLTIPGPKWNPVDGWERPGQTTTGAITCPNDSRTLKEKCDRVQKYLRWYDSHRTPLKEWEKNAQRARLFSTQCCGYRWTTNGPKQAKVPENEAVAPPPAEPQTVDDGQSEVGVDTAQKGTGGMSRTECIHKFCPECADAISLMEVSADSGCEACKKRNAAKINQCVSGGSRSSTSQSSSDDTGGFRYDTTGLPNPKVYYAYKRYQPNQKNYHYTIGKMLNTGMEGRRIIYGPDTFEGCRAWLTQKGYW